MVPPAGVVGGRVSDLIFVYFFGCFISTTFFKLYLFNNTIQYNINQTKIHNFYFYRGLGETVFRISFCVDLNLLTSYFFVDAFVFWDILSVFGLI